jgi:orotidine-5'-phosphate decarboxylase
LGVKKPKIFIPLDCPNSEMALAMCRQLQPLGPGFKVGLELFVAEGPAVMERISGLGVEVFLDLKFHDIPNTVAGAIRSAARLGASIINVHCGGGVAMMEAALLARNEAEQITGRRMVLLGVTVLTSLDDLAVQQLGFPRSTSQQVKHFVDLAVESGLDGVVCSAQELPLVRSIAGDSFVTMVPGIRPSWSSANDQKRVMTPREAAAAGAHCLVIGRPITGAPDPVEALRKVMSEL